MSTSSSWPVCFEKRRIKLLDIIFQLFGIIIFGSCVWIILDITISNKTTITPKKQEHSVLSDKDKDEPSTSHEDPNVINLLLVISKTNELNQAVTMLKSILLHHRHRRGIENLSDSCVIQWYTTPKKKCFADETVEPRQLMLHLIVHRKSWQTTKSVFTRWNSSRLGIRMYPFRTDVLLLGSTADQIPSVQFAMQHLMVPQIVDQSVEKIIALSPNLLFNEDIALLWKHFETFHPPQIIGGVCEQIEDCSTCCPKSGTRFPAYGWNMGLRLLHLKHMRRINWRKLYKDEVAAKEYFGVATGDLLYGVTNAILSKRAGLRYPLSCEWNVQAIRPAGLRSCLSNLEPRPTPRDSRECGNSGNDTLPVRVFQYDARRRNDVVYDDGEEPGRGTEAVQGQWVLFNEIRDRSVQLYEQIKQIPMECLLR